MVPAAIDCAATLPLPAIVTLSFLSSQISSASFKPTIKKEIADIRSLARAQASTLGQLIKDKRLTRELALEIAEMAAPSYTSNCFEDSEKSQIFSYFFKNRPPIKSQDLEKDEQYVNQLIAKKTLKFD